MATATSSTQAARIRQWANRGVALLTAAGRWGTGRLEQAMISVGQAPRNAALLRRRRTSVEAVVDLLAHVLGTTDQQQRSSIQGLANVRTCLSLATLTVQIAMIVTSRWALPLGNISIMMAAYT